MISETAIDGQERWLLGLATSIPAPLDWLFPEVNFAAFNVWRLEGLDPVRCAQWLLGLERAGAIAIREEQRALSGADLSEAIRDLMGGARRKASYRLTELGGKLWEEAAKPDWSRFIQVFSMSPGEDGVSMTGVVAGVNWDAVMAYVGHYDFLRDEHLVQESLRYTLHDRYNITYWKTLPSVHVFSFESCHPGPPHGAPKWLREWRDTITVC